MQCLRQLLVDLCRFRGADRRVEEPRRQHPAHRAARIGVTEGTGHPPRPVRPQSAVLRRLLQVVAPGRAPTATVSLGVGQFRGDPEHGRGTAPLGRAPAGEHHERAVLGERYGRRELLLEIHLGPGRACDRFEGGHQVVRRCSRCGRRRSDRPVDDPRVTPRPRAPRPRLQPLAGEGQPLVRPVVNTGDRRAPGGGHQQGEPRPAPEPEQTGLRIHLEPLVDGLVERHEHPAPGSRPSHARVHAGPRGQSPPRGGGDVARASVSSKAPQSDESCRCVRFPGPP